MRVEQGVMHGGPGMENQRGIYRDCVYVCLLVCMRTCLPAYVCVCVCIPVFVCVFSCCFIHLCVFLCLTPASHQGYVQNSITTLSTDYSLLIFLASLFNLNSISLQRGCSELSHISIQRLPAVTTKTGGF